MEEEKLNEELVEETPEVEEELEEVEETPEVEEEVSSKEDTLTYMGKQVISKGERTVGDSTFVHIRLIDGTSHDLTQEEFDLLTSK